MLVLLMGRIHMVSWWDGHRWHSIRIKFHDGRFRHSSNTEVTSDDNMKDCNAGIPDWRGLWIHPYDGLRCNDICIRFHNNRLYGSDIKPTRKSDIFSFFHKQVTVWKITWDVKYGLIKTYKFWSAYFSMRYLMEYSGNCFSLMVNLSI
jgi:hypothetical protein